jgi:hypothetical protein
MTERSITATLGDLVAAEPALERLLQRPLAAQPAYHVAKLVRLVRVETAHFHEQRNTIIKELGAERTANPAEQAAGHDRVTAVTPENVEAYAKRMQDLANVTVTIAWLPLSLSELGDAPITGADLLTLGALLVE